MVSATPSFCLSVRLLTHDFFSIVFSLDISLCSLFIKQRLLCALSVPCFLSLLRVDVLSVRLSLREACRSKGVARPPPFCDWIRQRKQKLIKYKLQKSQSDFLMVIGNNISGFNSVNSLLWPQWMELDGELVSGWASGNPTKKLVSVLHPIPRFFTF